MLNERGRQLIQFETDAFVRLQLEHLDRFGPYLRLTLIRLNKYDSHLSKTLTLKLVCGMLKFGRQCSEVFGSQNCIEHRLLLSLHSSCKDLSSFRLLLASSIS